MLASGIATWPNPSLTLNVHLRDSGSHMHVGDLPVGETLSSSHEYSSGSLKSMPLQVLRNWTRRSMLRIRTLARRTINAAFGHGTQRGESECE